MSSNDYFVLLSDEDLSEDLKSSAGEHTPDVGDRGDSSRGSGRKGWWLSRFRGRFRGGAIMNENAARDLRQDNMGRRQWLSLPWRRRSRRLLSFPRGASVDLADTYSVTLPGADAVAEAIATSDVVHRDGYNKSRADARGYPKVSRQSRLVSFLRDCDVDTKLDPSFHLGVVVVYLVCCRAFFVCHCLV